MRNRIATVLGTGAIVTTVLALGTMTAQAASGWTVTNGGSALGFSQVGSATVKDVNSGAVFTGTSGSATMNAPSGHHSSGTDLFSIGNNGNCFPPPLVLCWEPPWLIDATGFSSGLTSGTMSGSDATLTTSNAAGSCTATVSGTVNISYSNSSHTVTFSPDGSQLSVSSVSGDGCSLAGLTSGDVLNFNAALTESAGPYLSITSP